MGVRLPRWHFRRCSAVRISNEGSLPFHVQALTAVFTVNQNIASFVLPNLCVRCDKGYYWKCGELEIRKANAVESFTVAHTLSRSLSVFRQARAINSVSHSSSQGSPRDAFACTETLHACITFSGLILFVVFTIHRYLIMSDF